MASGAEMDIALSSMSIDGQIQEQLVIPLTNDRVEHWVEAEILQRDLRNLRDRLK
ncbi:hypothetical protein FACS1894170_11730 [Planctomycetales bacterium]|nr:hypothetical protein FACS1894170_11730 [Planctomycetales bacterium]